MRIYHPQALQLEQSTQLNKAASHHVARVLRARENDRVHLFDGHGNEYQGSIQQIDRNSVTVFIEKQLMVDTESKLSIHLGQALLHREKMDWVIQKAVELGVTHITPIITERSQVRLSQERYVKREQHWQNIIIHACEQCGRATLPVLHQPCELSQWVQHHQGILCEPSASLACQNIKLKHPTNSAILIGPEGGLTLDEVALAKAQQWQTIQLGPRILRTETAAISMLAILQAQFGDIPIAF